MKPASETTADEKGNRSSLKSAAAALVEFCGQVTVVHTGEVLTIGREADLIVDDNEFLHRIFLIISEQGGYWYLHNVGTQLGATVFESSGLVEAFLAPGASLPLVFAVTRVAFTAGATTYELSVAIDEGVYASPKFSVESTSGVTTAGPVNLTRDQRLLVIALSESRLRRDGRGHASLPSSPQAAARLGWTTTKFNRKLDNVCDKLSKLGVRGLQGDLASYASNRRSRLVEYAIATRLVTASDLVPFDRYVNRESDG